MKRNIIFLTLLSVWVTNLPCYGLTSTLILQNARKNTLPVTSPKFSITDICIADQLMRSGCFSRVQALRHAQVLLVGIDTLACMKRIPSAQMQQFLYLCSCSYELASRYLSSLIQEAQKKEPFWPTFLLGKITFSSREEIAKAEYLCASLGNEVDYAPNDMNELEQTVLLSHRKPTVFEWIPVSTFKQVNEQTMQKPFIIADEGMLPILKSMVHKGFNIEDYLNAQSIYRKSGLLSDSEDIRIVYLQENTSKSCEYISKRRSARDAAKFKTALREYELTVEIAKKIGRQEIEIEGFSQPVLIEIVRPRAFINTKEQVFMITDSAKGVPMDDFLSEQTLEQRQPYIKLLKTLFQRLFEKGVVWGSPYLRNMVIAVDGKGQITLTLVDWEKSVVRASSDVLPLSLKQECMVQVWRKAAILTKEERGFITSGYFNGPEEFDVTSSGKTPKTMEGIEVNFGRMMTMNPHLEADQITDGMNKQFLKARIALLETGCFQLNARKIPYLYTEHLLRERYALYEEHTEILYDLIYSASTQNLSSCVMPLIQRVWEIDWIKREISIRGLRIPQGLQSEEGAQSVLIKCIRFLWEMDGENRLREALDWINKNFENLFSLSHHYVKLRQEFFSAAEKMPSVVHRQGMMPQQFQELAEHLVSKMRRYRPDLEGPWNKNILITLDPQLHQLNIVYPAEEGEKAALFYQILKEQMQKFLQISEDVAQGVSSLDVCLVCRREIGKEIDKFFGENMVMRMDQVHRGEPRISTNMPTWQEFLKVADDVSKKAIAEKIYSLVRPLLLLPKKSVKEWPYQPCGTVLCVCMKAPFDLTVGFVKDPYTDALVDLDVYQGIGGGSVAVAKLLAQFGHPLHLITMVGSDMFGRAYQELLKRQDFSSGITLMQSPTKANIRLYAGNTSCVFSNAQVKVTEEELDNLMQKIEHAFQENPSIRYLVTGGGLPENVSQPLYAKIIAAAARAGVKTIVDFSSTLSRSQAQVEALLNAQPSIVKTNEDEFEQILYRIAAATEEEVARCRNKDRETLEAYFLRKAHVIRARYGIEIMLITMGEHGAMLVTAEQSWKAMLKGRREVTNTIAAGDSFIAGFLHEYIRGRSLDDALRMAVAAGTATTQCPGPQLASIDAIQKEEPGVIVSWVGQKPEPVIISGDAGGGQILRHALALSAIFSTPFLLKDIRAKRETPGLRATHVGTVDVAKAFTWANTSPYHRGTTSLYFSPSGIFARHYELDLEKLSNGSASLVSSLAQTIIPLVLFTERPCTVVLKGGTHLPGDLSALYLKEIVLPFLNRFFGVDASVEITRYGWWGKGEMVLTVHPLSKPLRGFELVNRGALRELTLYIQAAHLARSEMAQLEQLTSQWTTQWDSSHVPVTIAMQDVSSQSSEHVAAEILLKAKFDGITVGFSEVINFGINEDHSFLINKMITCLADDFAHYLQSNAVVDKYLADMIMLYMAFSEGTSVYSIQGVTDHIQSGVTTINAFLPEGKKISIEIEEQRPARVVVPGTSVRLARDQRLHRYAFTYGFFGNIHLLKKWIAAWGELMGISEEEVLTRMESNDHRHSYARAMLIPDELWVYLLPILQESRMTRMQPIFLKRAASIFKYAYNVLAEAVEGFYPIHVLPADSIMVSRLEKSGLDRAIFFKNFRDPPAVVKTSIFSPTFNSLLSEEEANAYLSDEEIRELSYVYGNMDTKDRQLLDTYLAIIWGFGEGFPALLQGKMRRSEWIRYLADWRVDSRYYVYMYHQKTKIPWDADFSGQGHKKLRDLLTTVFDGNPSISVDLFLINFKEALSQIGASDLALLVDNSTINLRTHLYGIADSQGILYAHQAKIFFKILRILLAAQADFKGMRNTLSHGARPFLHVILRNTNFAKRAAVGMLFVDEVTNGGENVLYLEIIGKAFTPHFQYKFFDMAQIHPELTRLYTKLGIVDGVLAPQPLHPLEDFPEIAEEQFEFDRSIPQLKCLRYKQIYEELKALLKANERTSWEQKTHERDSRVEQILSDNVLRGLLAEMEGLESYRKNARFLLGRALVHNYLRMQTGSANFIDNLIFPAVFFCGIVGFSNREYEMLDREWALVTRFRSRLNQLASEQPDLFAHLSLEDQEIKQRDYVAYLEQWCSWYEKAFAMIQETKKEIVSHADAIRNFLEGRIDAEHLVPDLMGSLYHSPWTRDLPHEKWMQEYIGEYKDLLSMLREGSQQALLVKAASVIIESHKKGGRLFMIGSAEEASLVAHMIVDFGKGVGGQDVHRRLAVISLNNAPWISALANDLSFASIYEEQLKNYRIGENDTIIALEADRVLSLETRNALAYAGLQGAKRILFAPAGLSAACVPYAEVPLLVGSNKASQVENFFLTINHALVELLKNSLPPEQESIRQQQEMTYHAQSYYGKLAHAVNGISLTQIEAVAYLIKRAVRAQKNIFVVGNGGHVSTASHVAYRLKTMVRELGLTSGVIMSLTENITDITGISQRKSYENIFLEQLSPMIKEGDLVIGISTSGNSENVIRAMQCAYTNRAHIVGLCGFSGGRIMGMPHHVYVPNIDTTHHYGRTEDIFLFVLNMILEMIETDMHAEQHAILEQQIAQQVGPQIEEMLTKRGIGTNPGCWVRVPMGHFYVKGAWEGVGKLGENQLRIEYAAASFYRTLGYRFPTMYLIKIGKHLLLASRGVPDSFVLEDTAMCQDDPECLYGFLVDCYLNNRNAAYPQNILRTRDGNISRLDAGGALISSSRGNIKALAPDVACELKKFRDMTVNPYGAELFAHISEENIHDALVGTLTYPGIAGLKDTDIEHLVSTAGFEEGIVWPLRKVKEIEVALVSCQNEKTRAALSEAQQVLHEVIQEGGLKPYIVRRLKERRDWLIKKYSILPRLQKQASEKTQHVIDREGENGLAYFKARGTWGKDLVKERLYGSLLQRLLPQGASVLDVGCGVGYLTIELRKNGLHSMGIDRDLSIIKEAKKIADTIGFSDILYMHADAAHIPVADFSLDAITMTNVLEHMNDKEARAFLEEAKRVLKEDGYVLIGVPVKSFLSMCKLTMRRLFDPYVWRHWHSVIDDTGDSTHKVWYTDKKLYTLLTGAGFLWEKTDYFVYRTAEWPRGKLIHRIQNFLDTYDHSHSIKKIMAFGIYMVAKKVETNKAVIRNS